MKLDYDLLTYFCGMLTVFLHKGKVNLTFIIIQRSFIPVILVLPKYTIIVVLHYGGHYYFVMNEISNVQFRALCFSFITIY